MGMVPSILHIELCRERDACVWRGGKTELGILGTGEPAPSSSRPKAAFIPSVLLWVGNSTRPKNHISHMVARAL